LGGGKRQNCKTTPEEIDRQRACELFDGWWFFEEIGWHIQNNWFWMQKELYYGDGVITGYGTINGRLTYFRSGLYCFEGHYLKHMQRKSVRWWIWPSKWSANDCLNDSGGAYPGRRSFIGWLCWYFFIEMCRQAV
jgi:propionyl-CoA carboxylase beta chain